MATEKKNKARGSARSKSTPTPDVIKAAENPDTSPPQQAASVRVMDAELNNNAADFPVVGIGASAGGLAAFEAFFSAMPAGTETGMAFVLVQHLAPDHKSMLADLIRRHTNMRVFEVVNGMVVHPDCIYIIPPNRDMALLNGALQLLVPSQPRGQRLPIDFFFRSLAQDRHIWAIGIVLSGTGSDGALGVRAIKGAGGMVIAQNPESTQFDGMPRSAIATGLVDYELPPAEMPAQLFAYATRALHRHVHLSSAAISANALQQIFILLRNQIGRDFSQYKPSTIQRRIERRMAVHQIEPIDAYVRFLQKTPAEVDLLFRDLLIGVTYFFRDPRAFRALEEQVIPKLFSNKPTGALIRVWVAGCSTGEEAYSIAILLQERMEMLKASYTVQVFATDIDSRAIATARAGYFPASVASDISAERLARFFTPEPDHAAYRIHKGIRDMLVFSVQDVVLDPPFSKLDLISCRNLLIYMSAELQKALMARFHHGLNPGGMLFLGSSEGVGDAGDLFTTLDRDAKLYQRKDDSRGTSHASLGRFLPHVTAIEAALPRAAGHMPFPVKLPLRELTEQSLLQQIAPAAALVNARGDILYLHGRTGMYLEPAPGETAVSNILKMAREGLRRDLTTALFKAAGGNENVHVPGVRVKTNGDFATIDLSVRPVPTGLAPAPGAQPLAPLYLIVIEEATEPGPAQIQGAGTPPSAPGSGDAATAAAVTTAEARIDTLTQELRAKDEYLQTSQAQLEASNEELKSLNEEMQSVNEELQSTNEELETSKEELQSTNEELVTVNTELQTRLADLSRLNNDMTNLLAGSGIATVFVDRQLRILRFTPSASELINLIGTDVGRPLGHIVTNLADYDRLVSDAQAVLDTLTPVETHVRSKAGLWFTLRIRPYRTLENVIEGVVMTFVDITEMKRIEFALADANAKVRLAAVVRDAYDAITVQDLQGRIVAWNPAAERVYGWTEAEAMRMNVRERIPDAQRKDELARLHELSRAEVLQPYRTQRIGKDGTLVDVWMTATALLNEAGQVYAIATTERAQDGKPARESGRGS